MPRSARKQAESGIYHIMLRGINRQRIFEDQQDCDRFLDVLAGYKELSGYELLGYCLMGNHAHILLRVSGEPLSTVMRRIASKYVYWYNAKYERIGHLFQERFKSEPVEDDAYLLTVLRYIHRNPIKAGLCGAPGQYESSSYNDYMGRSGITDTDFILSMMSPAELEEFTSHETNDECLDISPVARRRLTDENAADMLWKMSGCSSAAEFQALPAKRRDELLSLLLEFGASVRQASRLTGVPIGVVRKLTPGSRARSKDEQ